MIAVFFIRDSTVGLRKFATIVYDEKSPSLIVLEGGEELTARNIIRPTLDDIGNWVDPEVDPFKWMENLPHWFLDGEIIVDLVDKDLSK